MTDPTCARDYPQYMQLDHEADEADEAQANGCRFPPILPPSPEMIEAFLRRANERAAADLASRRYYLLTGKGRVSAERVDAAGRAQLERTKENT